MLAFLKQSTAVTLLVGPFVDSTDGNTVETGLTITQAEVRLSKNGANIAQKTEVTSLTYDEVGMYTCPVDATDTDTLGRLDLIINETGALIVKHSYMVVPANVWDSLFGADKLQVHADEITAGLITATAIATGAIDADAFAASAITATVIADGAIDAATFAAGAITATVIADGAIDAATFAAGAITAAVIATGAIDADALAADAGTEIADAVLNRDMATGTDSGSATVRTIRQALRFLRNKWTLTTGTLSVKKEDDTTESWAATVTTDALADLVTAVDPAS